VASWLSVTESSLGQMNEVLTRAKELAVSQASDTASAETRRMTAQEVRELYDQLVQLANARLGERYVFGGTRTLGPPVARDGAYNPLLSGNGEEMAVRVHGGDTVVMNITALEALEAGGTLETLRDLITALEGNDRSAVADGLTGLDRGMEAVNRCLAAVGGRTNGLDHAAAALQAAELDLREAVSGYEDADMAQTLTELLSQQTVYEAALRTTSIIMNRIRLMDLLG
jgi:flagellar hook-associated protein 3 FlgL